ncbi:MAG: hypothetical protein GYA55_09325 [SAR324 cluster bacterium]|uniref:TtsA-like Glycoside hydrolase family 108 domain-containing protein n=1 Tax=SAR324 cluster bacterium TaxID=2024889 RepID=A0A7X9FS81_9DELT|nr:hypothetical protein [SAR324 cluster bacterium]
MSKRDAATDGSGDTLWGVTQRTYQNYHKMHKGCKKCSHSVMQMTTQEHKDIFYKMYWKRFNIERLPPRVAWVVMDFAVNGGRPTTWKFEAARKIGIKFSSTEDFYRKINRLSPQQEDVYLHKLIGLKANYYGEIIERSFQRRKNAALKQGLSNNAAVLKAARSSLMRFHDGWQNRLIELACAVELEPNQDYFSTAYLVPRELKPPLNKRYGIDFGLTPNREGYLEAKVDGTPSLQQRYDDLKIVTKTKGVRLVNTGSNIGSAETSKEFKQAYRSLEWVIRAAEKNPNTSLKPQHINALIVRLQKLRDYYKVGFLKNLGSGFNYGSMYRSLKKVLNLLEASSSNGLQLSSTNKHAFEELLSKLKER